MANKKKQNVKSQRPPREYSPITKLENRITIIKNKHYCGINEMVELLWLKYGLLDLKEWVHSEEYLLDFIAELDTELKPFIDMLNKSTFQKIPVENKEWVKGINHKVPYTTATTGKEYSDMLKYIKNLAVRDRLLQLIQYQEMSGGCTVVETLDNLFEDMAEDTEVVA